MPKKADKDILDLLRREDPNFNPPVEADPAPTTKPRDPYAKRIDPKDLDTDNPHRLASKKTGAVFKGRAPHFWMEERASDPWDDVRDKGGRPIKQDVRLSDGLEHIDTTVWVEGEVFLEDRDQPFPVQYTRADGDLPENCTLVEAVRLSIVKVSSPSWPLTLVIEDLSDVLPPLAPGSVRHRWTSKRVRKEDVLRLLFDKGDKTTAELTEALFGPFTDSVRRNQASGKVRVHIHRLARECAIERTYGDHGVVLWRAIVAPPKYEAGHPALLDFTKPPEPPKGKFRLTIDGQTLVEAHQELRHEALPEFERVCGAVGLHVRVVRNDWGVTEPAPTKPPHRKHLHRRVDQGTAVAVLESVRMGQFELPVEEGGRLVYRPMLCYFKYWARMLYQPRIVAPSGGRWDTVFRDLPEPTRAEQCYLEMKAHRVLRGLERSGKVVRRKAPDGRTILFTRRDPEANDYPRAWERR